MRAVVLIALLAACDPADVYSFQEQALDGGVPSCPPVSLSLNGADLNEGDVLNADLRDVVLHNGIVRLRYGAHAMDFRDQGVTVENTERPFDHVLAARHVDHETVGTDPACTSAACHSNGSHWHDAFWAWYGDGSRYSVAGLAGDADRMRVLEASADAVTLSYEWDDVRLDALSNPGQCAKGYFPNCGETMIDAEGWPVYEHSLADVVKAIAVVDIWKIVRLERCDLGYYASLRSDPPLVWPEQGERGLRLGVASAVVTFTCDGETVARHPAADHVDLGETDCVGDLPVQVEGHDGWPFARFLVTSHSTAMRSLQYAGGLGSAGPDELVDRVGLDGRPEEFQSFIGAVEYIPGPLGDEPTPELLDLIDSARPTEWP